MFILTTIVHKYPTQWQFQQKITKSSTSESISTKQPISSSSACKIQTSWCTASPEYRGQSHLLSHISSSIGACPISKLISLSNRRGKSSIPTMVLSSNSKLMKSNRNEADQSSTTVPTTLNLLLRDVNNGSFPHHFNLLLNSIANFAVHLQF